MRKGHQIRCYDYVNHSYEKVRDTLRDHAAQVFSRATTAAASRAKSVAAELRVNIGAIEVGTEISIRVGNIVEEPRHGKTPATTRLELEWEAARSPHLVPFMKAELAIYPLTATETQLDLKGNYQPPLGALGSAIDAVVGHRIADASVHRFLTDVASYLKNTLSDG